MELTASAKLGDAIKWEQSNYYSRDKVTVISGQNLAILAVVGMITASAKITELAPAATDGSETAHGIMVAAVDASAADAAGVAIVRDAMIAPSALVWPTGITDPQKATALAELKAAGIVAREEA